MSKTAIFMQVIAALAAGGFLKSLFDWFKDRRKLRLQDEIEEQTQSYKVELAGLQTLQGKLAYVEAIVDVQAEQLARQNSAIRERDEENTRLWTRIRELETEVQKISRQAEVNKQKSDSLAYRCSTLESELKAFISAKEQSS